MMTNPFAKTEIYGYQTLYREIGYYIARIEQHEKAIKFFNEALKKTPDDKRALVGRSRSRAKISEYEGALEDIVKALELDPEDLIVLAHKALDTYLCCEFEAGLVQNSRLVPKRQKPDNFAMGVMQCSDAIENCLGERAGRPLRDHFKIIRKLAWKKNYAAHKPFEPKPRNKPKKKKVYLLKKLMQSDDVHEPVQPIKMKSKQKSKAGSIVTLELQIKDSLHSNKVDEEPIPPFLYPFPFRPLQSHTTNIENYMAEKYLDSMYLDKIFLKTLLSEPGVRCPNEGGSKSIKQLAKNCYKTVCYKQEVMRTRRPFYFIKYQEATSSGALRDRQKMELEHQQRMTKIEADGILNKVLEAYECKNLKLLLELVEKLKHFCDSRPKKLLPDKNIYMNEIYDKVCKGFYELYRINASRPIYEQKRRLYFILGLPSSREPSTDSVVGQFKNVFIDYKKEIHELEKRLKDATSPDEICWFYHELSRYQYEMKKYNLSRVYARKCNYEANIIDNQRWIFNSTMLLMKNNLAEHNKNDAKSDISNALISVNKLQDKVKIDFLTRCSEVVESYEFEDVFGKKQLEMREDRIINMMASSKMKDEVAHLFRQMAAMPACRRMVVIPGVRAQENESSKSAKSRTMSIMPGANTASSVDSNSIKRQSSKKRVNAETSGIDMMDLIEFHV